MSFVYPNEQWPSDAAIEALDGITDAETGLPYVPKGVGPTSVPTYEVQYNRVQHRLKRILAPWRQGQVVSEGGLQIGVYPLRYRLGGADKEFSGATGVAVPDDAVSYVYLDDANVLQVAASLPAGATTYLPLAKVTAAAGQASVEDLRPRVAFRVPQIEGPGDLAGTERPSFQIDQGTGGPLLKNSGGALRVRTAADDADADVYGAVLRATSDVEISGTSVAGALPRLSVQAGSEVNDSIDVTVQVEDLNGAALAGYYKLYYWISDAEYGGVVSGVGAPTGGSTVIVGTSLGTITSGVHARVQTDATGQAVIRVTDSTNKTFYVMVELNGLIQASPALVFV